MRRVDFFLQKKALSCNFLLFVSGNGFVSPRISKISFDPRKGFINEMST